MNLLMMALPSSCWLLKAATEPNFALVDYGRLESEPGVNPPNKLPIAPANLLRIPKPVKPGVVGDSSLKAEFGFEFS